jgi:hypothetical protein
MFCDGTEQFVGPWALAVEGQRRAIESAAIDTARRMRVIVVPYPGL